MRFTLYILTGLFLPLTAFAFPQAPIDSLERPLSFLSLENIEYDYNGIVKLSNCSASLIRFNNQPEDSQAYVLTNGHCLKTFFGGFLQPGEVRYKESSNRRMDAYINVNETVRIRANSLVYGTMTDTDAALYRINSTYKDLKDKGIEAFYLSDQRPSVNDDIHIVSGYWREGFSCSIEKFVHELHESNWVMKDSIRYSPQGCEVYGGTSGSPVILAGERLVVGVNNTGNESGQECKMNNPCEVDEDGNITVIEGRGYAQQTYWFYSCLDENFDIDLDIEGCRLPKP